MTQNLRNSINWGVSVLKGRGIDTSRLDAEVLLAKALESERLRLFMERERELNEEESRRFYSFVQRRTAREPVSYIIGEKEFWSLNFRVRRGVLIPRPETEFLVEAALEIAKGACSEGCSRREKVTILDLGTGSGNIAVALAKEIEDSHIIAVDSSDRAVEVAKENIDLHSVRDRVFLMRADFRHTLCFRKNTFDMIVSNPPYIPTDEMKGLLPEVRDFEPVVSLDGGSDGLELIRQIARKAPHYLKNGGSLLLEIGKGQKDDVVRILEKNSFDDIRSRRDLAGIERVVIARKANH
jgi:release factor glutamine methyltransferase